MVYAQADYTSLLERLEPVGESVSARDARFVTFESPLSAVLSVEQVGNSVRLSLVVTNNSGNDWFFSDDSYSIWNGFAIYRDGQRIASAPEYTELGRPAITDRMYKNLPDGSNVTLWSEPVFAIEGLVGEEANATFLAKFQSRQMLPSLSEELRERGLVAATVLRSNRVEFTCKRDDQDFICTF